MDNKAKLYDLFLARILCLTTIPVMVEDADSAKNFRSPCRMASLLRLMVRQAYHQR